uniref:Uncharacterized protein n=1 Tax=Candidatus Kentrum sp. SD TaxID=2126332 RepID=A0A451BLJ2_9GAMM|nr:MAG: hypothetical protein BECKSD772F_GA0070984_11638 [Candidatus Kentron sp. SD]VFK49306.1 MAG: hypothetical protein BECKSD772E_GA0070983_11708 [Candidatus Kentron sp. SD]VFK79172.1 MAG: hypothetical protein BECKSD772D_GA0070982_103819 [Candidatus Kentron sp. SD]
MMFDAVYRKFDVGRKDAEIDKNGIVMAAIQALYQKIREQEKTLTEQEARMRGQERVVARLTEG